MIARQIGAIDAFYHRGMMAAAKARAGGRIVDILYNLLSEIFR
ncbi:hypothetical protein [Sphingomonas sp. SCN 67-18]|nr:hypothetical protein [Sphingomonas sp. SCN 67-18]